MAAELGLAASRDLVSVRQHGQKLAGLRVFFWQMPGELERLRGQE